MDLLPFSISFFSSLGGIKERKLSYLNKSVNLKTAQVHCILGKGMPIKQSKLVFPLFPSPHPDYFFRKKLSKQLSVMRRSASSRQHLY